MTSTLLAGLGSGDPAGSALAGVRRPTTASVVVTASAAVSPVEARCHTCGATWTSTPGSGGLAGWLRSHPCEPDLPAFADLDQSAAGPIAFALQEVAAVLLGRTLAARTANGHLASTDEERAFWQAVGRHDGLLEAHRYLLATADTLHDLATGGGQR